MEAKQDETNSEIFPEDTKKKISDGGRPSANRDLIRRLLQENRYTYQQIADHVGCSDRTVRRARDELLADGLLNENEAEKGIGIVAADFDDETLRANRMAMSFSDYLRMKRPKSWKQSFSFCRKTWEHVWNKPSLVLVADRREATGDQVINLFMQKFGSDLKRIRDRKKSIRPLFKFLGRDDLNDKYLTMTKMRDEIPKRRVPEIEFLDFPLLFDKALQEYEEKYGIIQCGILKAKLVWGFRTGSKKDERGLAGMVTGTKGKSSMYFKSVDEYAVHIFEKQNEEWDISWTPRPVREILFKQFSSLALGSHILDVGTQTFRDRWYKVSEPILGFRLLLHDFRKVFITWLIICGVPLELAAGLNVGWLDLNTLKEHYLHIRTLLAKTKREAYRANIPDWFKEGLDEYTETL